jgi:hypothetical protein
LQEQFITIHGDALGGERKGAISEYFNTFGTKSWRLRLRVLMEVAPNNNVILVTTPSRNGRFAIPLGADSLI